MRARSAAVLALLALLSLLSLVACGPPAIGSIGLYARREPSTGRVVVTEVPAGSAGARAGLEPGDEIVAIDGVPVEGLSKEQFQGGVRGPVGSKVTLDVRRDGVVQRVVVERAALHPRAEGRAP